jgi:hypothetical protein
MVCVRWQDTYAYTVQVLVLSMQHGPRTTSGAVQSNRANGASATPLGPVWAYARYPMTKYMSYVDAACVCECGGPTHDELAAPCNQIIA